MISLILAESALETVPAPMQRHSSVRSHARKLGRRPSEILLDNSWHYAAMRGAENEIKRGRPDIVHFGLLAATSTPLYLADRIRIYVHTVDDHVIAVGSSVSLPKSYHRFEGVFAKLYRDGVITAGSRTLLEIKRMGFSELVSEIDPSKVIGLSREGVPGSFPGVAKLLDEDACIVVGGFQKGHFAESTKKSVDGLYQIDRNPLESHIVTGRILYEYEKTIFM